MAKTTNYTLERVTGKWRLNGRYSAPPRIGQLRRNSAGHPIDATGKRVPLASIAATKGGPVTLPKARKKAPKPKPTKARKKATKPKPTKATKARKKAPKKAPKPKTKLVKRRRKPGAPPRLKPGAPGSPVPVFKLPKGRRPTKKREWPQIEYVPQGGRFTERKLLGSSFENVKAPEYAGEVLYNTITKLTKSGKGQTAPDNIVLYQYGIQIYNTTATGNPADMQRAITRLADDFPDFTFRFNENVVHVLRGDPNEPVTRNRAAQDLRNQSAALAEIWNTLADLWDYDIGWFVEAENDEIEGY